MKTYLFIIEKKREKEYNFYKNTNRRGSFFKLKKKTKEYDFYKNTQIDGDHSLFITFLIAIH